MTLYTDLVAAGIPINNHCSDLYVKVTPESTEILQRHPINKADATTFMCQIDKVRTYDVPFAFDPYWERKKTP